MNGKKKYANRYPWKRWLRARAPHTIVRGVHYDCTTHGMAQMIRNVAVLKNVRVSLEVGQDEITITVLNAEDR